MLKDFCRKFSLWGSAFVFHVSIAGILAFAFCVASIYTLSHNTVANIFSPAETMTLYCSMGYIVLTGIVFSLLSSQKIMLCDKRLFWGISVLTVLGACAAFNCFWKPSLIGDAVYYQMILQDKLPKLLDLRTLRAHYALLPFVWLFGKTNGIYFGNILLQLIAGINVYFLARFVYKNEYAARVSAILFFLFPLNYLYLRIPQVDLFGTCLFVIMTNLAILNYLHVSRVKNYRDWKFWVLAFGYSSALGFAYHCLNRGRGSVWPFIMCAIVWGSFLIAGRICGDHYRQFRIKGLLCLAFMIVVPLGVNHGLNNVIMKDRLLHQPGFAFNAQPLKSLDALNFEMYLMKGYVVPPDKVSRYTFYNYCTAFQKCPVATSNMFFGKLESLATLVRDINVVFNYSLKKEHPDTYAHLVSIYQNIQTVFRIFFGALLMAACFKFYRTGAPRNLLVALMSVIVFSLLALILFGECRSRYMAVFYGYLAVIAAHAFLAAPIPEDAEKTGKPPLFLMLIPLFALFFMALFWTLHKSPWLSAYCLQKVEPSSAYIGNEEYKLEPGARSDEKRFYFSSSIPRRRKQDDRLTIAIPLSGTTAGRRYRIWGYFYRRPRQKLAISVNGGVPEDITAQLSTRHAGGVFGFSDSYVFTACEDNHLVLTYTIDDSSQDDKDFLVKVAGLYLEPLD